ncbi:hypothetical protein M4951_06400 [Blastopirellula sp. J2-11]|uniref:hypothetical protein n=1 Tax=Blastopirellula sp. J2-11 TaxID=2943192 RepID=UPI0021C8AECB|nr:hypothetical protein [Blastopirellula sp. J2-11]UUO07941.1 hypothetical protein M4951_06400 [Blastopirellula sp. J2-11]
MNSSTRLYMALTFGMAAVLTCSTLAFAQETPNPHKLYHEGLPPGAIGQLQLLQKRPVAGWFQPVEIAPPAGTKVSFTNNGQFGPDLPAPAIAGCLIGQVYRMRLSEIPLNPGAELYPTVEVIDRLYPPPGLELKYPIPVHITQEEIRYAMEGKFVTRIIYLEPPIDAVPVRQEKDFQPFFEVPPGGDPIQIADELGRPVAILRMGSRQPSQEEPQGEFDYRSPPIMVYDTTAIQQMPPQRVEQEAIRQPAFPRVPPTAYLPPNVAERPLYAPPGNVQTR